MGSFEHAVSAKLRGLDITIIMTPLEAEVEEAREFALTYLADHFRVCGELRMAQLDECPGPDGWAWNPRAMNGRLMWCFVLAPAPSTATPSVLRTSPLNTLEVRSGYLEGEREEA